MFDSWLPNLLDLLQILLVTGAIYAIRRLLRGTRAG